MSVKRMTWIFRAAMLLLGLTASASAQTPAAVAPANLPAPTATTLGGVKSLAAASNQFLTAIGTDGTPTQAQPSASNVSGLAGCASVCGTATSFPANWPTGTTVSNSTVRFYPPFAGTITSVDYQVGTGSFTLAIQIGGVNVTSCNALTVNSATKTNTACTAANTFTANQLITIVITGVASSPSDAYVGVNMTRTS